MGWVKTAIFIAFSRYVFGIFRNKNNGIIQYYLVPPRFPLTPKYVTLNDHECLFYVKFCVASLCAEFFCVAFGENCTKTDKQ